MNTSIEMQTDKPIPSTSREMPDAILVESNANDTLVSAPTVIDDREWGVEWIVACRSVGREKQFLTEWLDYDETTWLDER